MTCLAGKRVFACHQYHPNVQCSKVCPFRHDALLFVVSQAQRIGQHLFLACTLARQVFGSLEAWHPFAF